MIRVTRSTSMRVKENATQIKGVDPSSSVPNKSISRRCKEEKKHTDDAKEESSDRRVRKSSRSKQEKKPRDAQRSESKDAKSDIEPIKTRTKVSGKKNKKKKKDSTPAAASSSRSSIRKTTKEKQEHGMDTRSSRSSTRNSDVTSTTNTTNTTNTTTNTTIIPFTSRHSTAMRIKYHAKKREQEQEQEHKYENKNTEKKSIDFAAMYPRVYANVDESEARVREYADDPEPIPQNPRVWGGPTWNYHKGLAKLRAFMGVLGRTIILILNDRIMCGSCQDFFFIYINETNSLILTNSDAEITREFCQRWLQDARNDVRTRLHEKTEKLDVKSWPEPGSQEFCESLLRFFYAAFGQYTRSQHRAYLDCIACHVILLKTSSRTRHIAQLMENAFLIVASEDDHVQWTKASLLMNRLFTAVEVHILDTPSTARQRIKEVLDSRLDVE